MSFDLKSIRKNTSLSAPRVTLYGVEGIGKTTFAANTPSPIFIPTEDGLGSLEVDHFPLATSSNDVMQMIDSLMKNDHDYKTVVLDSADWLETMINNELEANNKKSDLAYGKQAIMATERFRQVLLALQHLRDEKGMAVVVVAHCQIKRFDSPETEPYDRYQIKMNERISAVLREWSDAVFFANYKTRIRETDVGFNKKVSRAESTGERVMYTNERPAYQAKNRYSLPDVIDFSWEAFVSSINTNVKV